MANGGIDVILHVVNFLCVAITLSKLPVCNRRSCTTLPYCTKRGSQAALLSDCRRSTLFTKLRTLGKFISRVEWSGVSLNVALLGNPTVQCATWMAQLESLVLSTLKG